MNCSSGGERISRHNSLRDCFHDLAREAGLGPRKEVRFLLPGRDSRPADIYLPNWCGGKDMALDVTVVNPLQDSLVSQAAQASGHALAFAFNRKMRGMEEACERQGFSFLPLVCESLGGWGNEAIQVVKRLSSSLARQTSKSEAVIISHTWGKLGIILQRYNGQILANRVSHHPLTVIDGYQ